MIFESGLLYYHLLDEDNRMPNDAVTGYPTGNEFFAWQLAAKTQQRPSSQECVHDHATQAQRHDAVPNEAYSTETHSFRNRRSKHHSLHERNALRQQSLINLAVQTIHVQPRAQDQENPSSTPASISAKKSHSPSYFKPVMPAKMDHEDKPQKKCFGFW